MTESRRNIFIRLLKSKSDLDIVEFTHDAVRELIEVLEAPERTGRWINGKCDQCGGDAPYWPMASTYYESDFCQHCGSPMEVEHEDDYDYERASDMRDYCERYEPTYNPEDGSM